MKTKICRKCGRELPLTNTYYYKQQASQDGYATLCKECKGASFSKNNNATFWTEEESALLKKYYNDYLNIELHELYFSSKTPRAIESKARRMNLGEKTQEAKQRAMQNMAKTKIEYFKTHDGDLKGFKHSKESREKMSKAKKSIEKWVWKDNPRNKNPLFGKDNGRWQGGITDLYRALRNELGDWKKQSMQFCNYKCIVTGGEFEDIHHQYPFKDIIYLTFDDLKLEIKTCQQDYTDEEWHLISDKLLKYHYLYGYGACIHKKIHQLFHEQYKYANFSYKDFLDFIDRIQSGDFQDWFAQNNLEIHIDVNYVDYIKKYI